MSGMCYNSEHERLAADNAALVEAAEIAMSKIRLPTDDKTTEIFAGLAEAVVAHGAAGASLLAEPRGGDIVTPPERASTEHTERFRRTRRLKAEYRNDPEAQLAYDWAAEYKLSVQEATYVAAVTEVVSS